MEKKTMLAGKKKNSSQNRISQITATILVLLLLANVMTVYLLSKNLVFAQLVRRNVMGAGPIIAAAIAGSVTERLMDKVNDTDAIILMTNFERIRTQLMLTERSLANGDSNMAFAHSYITHTVIFPSIKNILEKAGYANSAKKLESGLTDITFMIKTGDPVTVKRDLIVSRNDLTNVYNQILNPILKTDKRDMMLAQTAALLLNDANRSYQLSNLSLSQSNSVKAGGLGSSVSSANNYNTNIAKKNVDNIDYQNALGLIQVSQANYGKISNSLSNNKNSEIKLAYNQLINYMGKRSDKQTVSRLFSELESDLTQELSSARNYTGSISANSNRNTTTTYNTPATDEDATYFSTIQNDLKSAIAYVKAGNYGQADDTVVTAYLDNFEYLERPIDKYDHKLKIDIELALREHLRDMLNKKAHPSEIVAFINGIRVNLDKAESLLRSKSVITITTTAPSAGSSSKNELSTQLVSSAGTIETKGKGFADIQALSKGFGVYTGDRPSIGQADESSKGIVRNDVDQIGSKLNDMLSTYKKGNYEEAFSTSRSAYLDNYESVEIPLRPINPDFTLDMEIKFAELRNLIHTKVTYDKVQSKVFEIKQGLDESERLVSGTGVVAPGIAFSTSFSIIFREGLESALIIGAILTYLEASRNYRFKKHVYYGIIISIVATAVTWSVAQYIIEVSGANREIIEAVAGISAVAILFWVSFWVLNKIETKKWIEFVKAKVWKATTTGSVIVFVLLSFFTVYREGFETVLFYQAMLSFAKYMEWYVIAGFISGLAVIIGIVFLIRRLGRKLPLRLLFGLTMGVGAYMSIAFMGNAIRSFQEIGYISTTSLIGVVPRLDINLAEMTGIHPTLESVVAQLILLAIYTIGSVYILVIQPRRKKAIESARKSMADLERNKK
jgi:high-affinity iron transporter